MNIPSKPVSIVAAAIGAAAAQAQGQLIVDWGSPDFVGQAERLSAVPNLNPSGGSESPGSPSTLQAFVDNTSFAFNESTPLTPTPEGWTPQSGKTNQLYGGFETVGPGNRVAEFAQIINNGAGDTIRIGLQSRLRAGVNIDLGFDNFQSNSLGTLVTVPKAEFLNGGDGRAIEINDDAIITANVGSNNNGGDRRFRLVIEQDDQYYIGTAPDFTIVPPPNLGVLTVSSGPDNGGREARFSDFVFETYDPFSGVYFGDDDVGTGTAFTGVFDDIQTIGIYVEASQGDNTNLLRNAIRGFSVEVPEPASLPGDANGDGTVDLADFGILRANFGSTMGTFATGDFNGDMNVDLADFGILRANFGTSVGSDFAALDAWYATVVPEPTTLALAGLAGFAMLRRRR
ncbi:MAG: PEP-CTERM sorting domain-containing protein [Planctomycetota bacterium]